MHIHNVLNASICQESQDGCPKKKRLFPMQILIDGLNNVCSSTSSMEAHLSGSMVLLASMRAKKTGTIAAHRCLSV